MNKNNSHMKTIFRTLACLGVLGLMACQQFEIDTQMTPEKAAASIRMECDALPAYTVASTSPGAITFKVSSNTPWTITRSSGADWCTVTPSSSSAGALISDVVVSFTNNTGVEDRMATLTLKGDKVEIPVSIKITQARQGRLFVTPVSQDYAAVGGPLTFTIQTNVDWEVRSSEGWLSFNRESGNPDPEGRTLTVIATAAASEVLERTATVTVVAGDEEESFEVTQKGVFDLTEISESFSGDGATKGIRVRTDLPWKVTTDKDWISFDQESGVGDGSAFEIKATASANESMARKANITVTAGGVEKTFEVAQDGAVFEIVAPASTEIKPTGEEIILEVKSSLAWEVSTDVEAWTVEKADANHIKLTAPFNNAFLANKGNVTIKGQGGAEFSLELNQGICFKFEGHYEMLPDGSVKLYGDQTSNITLLDGFRYGSVELKLGEVNFADGGNFWFECKSKDEDAKTDCQLYNWCVIGKTRLRAEGTANGKSMKPDGSSYMSTDYSLSAEEFNAMTSYKMILGANAEDPTLLDMEFIYNGESKCVATCQNPFTTAGLRGNTFIGFHSTSADSWVILKSCDVSFLAE